jgi:hypothetical protein
MTTAEALRIGQSLADGICPFTGQTLPPGSPYQHADVVRALFIAIGALHRSERRDRRNRQLPENAGRLWDKTEEQQLCEEFAGGKSIPDLALSHKRTQGAITSRLEKLGKIPPEPRRQF